MNYIKNYSPYVYLNRISEDRYSIFVTICYFSGQTIQPVGASNVFHTNGSSTLTFEIRGKSPEENAIPSKRYHVCEFLQPISEHGSSFDPKSFCIKVNTKCYFDQADDDNNIDEEYTIKVLYEDADEESITVVNDIALNSPYLYLNNPSSEIERSVLYNPYCLVFIKGVIIDFISHKETAEGVFEQKLQLIGKNNSSYDIEMIAPIRIPANSTVYTDEEEVTGYFETIIYHKKSKKGKKKKRKGRLRNASADGNPTKFRS